MCLVDFFQLNWQSVENFFLLSLDQLVCLFLGEYGPIGPLTHRTHVILFVAHDIVEVMNGFDVLNFGQNATGLRL